MASSTRKSRKTYSCDACKRSKLKCDRQSPCSSCKYRACEDSCTYAYTAGPGLATPSSLRSTDFSTPITSAPAAASLPTSTESVYDDLPHSRWDAVFERPVQHVARAGPGIAPVDGDDGDKFSFPFAFGPKISREELLQRLPPWHCCEYLITQYFTLLSPLFHVLHGPAFERQYYAFKANPNNYQPSWLALLFAILSMAVLSIENDGTMLAELWSDPDVQNTAALSCRFRTAATICLAQDNFLINHSLNTLEALLILIYTISHDEGVDRGWVLLGMSLNIGIALQCNVDNPPSGMNCIEVERRRRCWAGILLLHTYQAIMHRDINMGWLTNIPAVMPADVNDKDITERVVLRPSSQPTQMSVMMYKLRLFQLSNRICTYLTKTPQDEESLVLFDAEIASEQRAWDATFLSNSRPNLLDASSYAFWCILQLYANHLYLLIHRPFCRYSASNTTSSTTSSKFRPASRAKCISSGAALLDLHQQFCENPRLRHYRWNVYGMTSSYALHGAVALASCLLDQAANKTGNLNPVPDPDPDPAPYRAAFDAALLRVEKSQDRSPICKKAYPILRHFQTMLSPDNFQWSDPAGSNQFGNIFDEWVDSVQWLNSDSINWNYWDGVLNVDEAIA
ncbi:hypothetical protein BDV19DRAFT_388171 [Aspergillus venezuelensis]